MAFDASRSLVEEAQAGESAGAGPPARRRRASLLLGLGGVWRCRHFWWHLTKSELRSRYRRSYLGIFWSLLNPLLMTLVCTLVFGTFFGQSPIEFAPMVFSGLVVWDFISRNVTAAANSIIHAEPYIRQAPLPVVIYPLRTTLAALFHLVVAIGMLLIFSLIVLGPSTALLSLPLSLLIIAGLGWCASTINAITAVFFRDWMYLSSVLLQFGFYASPIIYSPAMLSSHGLDLVYQANPVHHVLQLVREPLLDQRWPAAAEYSVAAGCLLLLALLASWIARAAAKKLIFRL
jgi:lipopolysaccharide transport system permease protein